MQEMEFCITSNKFDFYLAFINLILARIAQENLNILHINYPMGTVHNCNSRLVPGFLMQGHDC